MEQCSGEMLANRVDSPSYVSMFAAEIAEMQTRLASINFSQYEAYTTKIMSAQNYKHVHSTRKGNLKMNVRKDFG